MRWFLFVLSIPAFGFGILVMVSAKSAVHEIEAGIAFLVGATFLTGAGVCDTIAGRSAKLEKSVDRLEATMREERVLQVSPPSNDDEAFRQWRAEAKRKD